MEHHVWDAFDGPNLETACVPYHISLDRNYMVAAPACL